MCSVLFDEKKNKFLEVKLLLSKLEVLKKGGKCRREELNGKISKLLLSKVFNLFIF